MLLAGTAPALAAPAPAQPAHASAPAVSAVREAVSAAADTIGISARPAGADGKADTRTRFSYAVDPGQRVEDHILIINTGTTEQTFRIVGTDAYNDDKGQYALLATDAKPKATGTWVHFDNGTNRTQLDLKPGESTVLAFSFAVPADATPGDHVAGIVASVITAGQQVNLDRRVATRLYARVSGPLQPQLTIGSIDASYSGDWWNPLSGSVIVRYSVRNSGNIALASNLTAGINTWFGIPAAAQQGGSIQEILPGNTAAYEFQIKGVAQWLYLNPYLTLNPFVDSPDQKSQVAVAPTTRDTVAWGVPWDLVILLLIIGGGVLFWWWRRRRDAAQAQAWIEYTQAQARAEAQKEAQLVTSGQGDGAHDG
jgi:hypothetical protein